MYIIMWLSEILYPNWSLTTYSCLVFQMIKHYLFTAYPSETGTTLMFHTVELLFLISYKCNHHHLASLLSIVVKMTKDLRINTVILLWTAQCQVTDLLLHCKRF